MDLDSSSVVRHVVSGFSERTSLYDVVEALASSSPRLMLRPPEIEAAAGWRSTRDVSGRVSLQVRLTASTRGLSILWSFGSSADSLYKYTAPLVSADAP